MSWMMCLDCASTCGDRTLTLNSEDLCWKHSGQRCFSQTWISWLVLKLKWNWRTKNKKSLRRSDGNYNKNVTLKLNLASTILRLFDVGHVAYKKRRGALSLAWYQWLSCKGKEWKIYCCELALPSAPQIWKFHVVHLTPSSYTGNLIQLSTCLIPNFRVSLSHRPGTTD